MKPITLLVVVLVLVGCLLAGGRPAAAGTASVDKSNSIYLVLATEDDWKWSPKVAYDPVHNVYLVVWENLWPNGDHDIYGRLVTASGVLSLEFVVYSGTYYSKQPDVAYDSISGRFLVVWSYDSTGDGTDYDIYGRYIPWNGPSFALLPFGIDESRDNTDKPHLAFSSTSDEFLVVWKVEADPPYIAGGILHNDGTGFPVAISSGPEARDFPAVTYNLKSNEFVVVWDENVSRDNTLDLDIYAVRLNAAGVIQPPGEFLVSGLASNEQHPTVAACSGADVYLFAWQQQVNPTSSDDNIFGRLMSGSGTLQQSYGLAGTTLPQRYPAAACNLAGTEFALVWHDQYAQPLLRWGVWAELISTNLFVQPAFEVVRPGDDRDRLYPAIAYGKYSLLVVWQHARDNSGYLDIWAQVVYPHTVFMPGLRK